MSKIPGFQIVSFLKNKTVDFHPRA